MPLFRPFIICLALLLAAAAPAQAQIPPQPTWQQLDFQEKALWATADATIHLADRPADAKTWYLGAVGSIENTFERSIVVFDPVTGDQEQRWRLTKGRADQRLKTWVYQDDFIVRRRQDPTADTLDSTANWPLTSERQITYPAAVGTLPLVSPYLLVVLGERLAAQGPGASTEVLVNTDMNFYRARLTALPVEPVRADYKLANGDKVEGMRDTVPIRITVEPEGALAEKDDFSLLGLYGVVTLYIDPENGLPLLLHGRAPRLGDMNIHLRRVKMREGTQ